ncbi:MAG: hypothetical protein DSY77_14040 [Bacteroidetes bacterium]|jgi:hypothetical protein|nr:MAG: hypothetical protein DSY77_14040 [Bacteroidota bacterium]|tara:strand:+ start:179 stop:385 length:207 start_codon:yes stop_codon:yes gene_type:complete
MKNLVIKLLSAIFVAFVFAIPAFSGEELHVCPGGGESCNATITYGGETVNVESEKNKGSGTVVVKQVN